MDNSQETTYTEQSDEYIRLVEKGATHLCCICHNEISPIDDDDIDVLFVNPYDYYAKDTDTIVGICQTCVKSIVLDMPELFLDVFSRADFKRKTAKLMIETMSPNLNMALPPLDTLSIRGMHAIATHKGSSNYSNDGNSFKFTSHNPKERSNDEGTTSEKDSNNIASYASTNNMSPKKIHAMLNEYVVGQDDAKEILSIASYSHMKRINATEDTFIEKDNVLLIGPTGSGKTHLLKTLSQKVLSIPFTTFDANTLTAAGYVGQDVEAVLHKLLVEADGDLEAAQKGIVFIDEIDKLAKNKDSEMNTVAVQQALLKLIEGGEYQIAKNGSNKSPDETITFDTTDTLFIFGGAFVGLEGLISPTTKPHRVGFGSESDDVCSSEEGNILTPSHLREFGLIPEFIGRISMYSRLKPLDRTMLRRILTEPKNSLVESYINQFKVDNIDFSFTEDALNKIADYASTKNEGARSLKTILARSLKETLYNLPGSDVKQYSFKASEVKKEMSE